MTGISKDVLIAVDASEASLRAVSYVAETLGPHTGSRVYLLHVLPPIPPELLEFGGSEDPAKEETLSTALKRAQAHWLERVKKEAAPIFDRAAGILCQAGMPPGMVHTEFAPSIHRPDIVRDVLEAARKWACGTIVAGRHGFPWLKEQLVQHVGEELVRKGRGFAIWVVE